LAHHEGVEAIADFLAKRALNSAFELALHEVDYDRLVAFQMVIPGEGSYQRVRTTVRID